MFPDIDKHHNSQWLLLFFCCSHFGQSWIHFPETSRTKGDLYENRPERIKKYTERFGKCKCLYLGEDDMTFEKLLELNYKFAQEEK